MQEDVRNDLKSQLALRIARGKTITAWARQNEVPLRTAYRWSREPQVRSEVQEWRRYVLDLAISRLARLSLKATDGIAKLGAGAESESVQLRAWRAILADQMAIAKFSDLEQRMTEVEEQIRERTGCADHSS
jgi:ribonuclease D